MNKNLILIHGAIGSADQMQPLANALSNEFDIHLLELDGHGKSSGSSHSFSIEHFTNQIDAFANQINEDVHVFGYSMGGFLALLTAAHGNKHIRSILTLGTKMKWNEEIAIKESKMLDADKIAEKVPNFALALANRHGANQWKKVLSNTSKLLTEIGRRQPINAEVIGSIKCPVHLCLADQDTMVTEEETRVVEKWAKAASFSQLPNSKHPIEQVDVSALANKIRSFIELA